jgi:hypothetical protein
MRDAPAALNTADAPEEGARGPLARRLHVVRRLAGKALEIAKSVWRGANAPAPRGGRPADRTWLEAVYERAERALRMALLLQARLIGELKALGGKAASDAERAEADLHGFAEQASRELGVKDLLPRAAQGDDDEDLDADEDEDEDEDEDREEFERLEGLEDWTPDRCGGDPLYDYVMSRPVDALIDEIRCDLGLTPEWLREVVMEWELQEFARAGAETPPAAVPRSAPSRTPAGPPSERPSSGVVVSRTAASDQGEAGRASGPP